MKRIMKMDSLIHRYFESLSEKEKKAYLIAESHLGSLFNIEKTAGFLQWKAKLTNK